MKGKLLSFILLSAAIFSLSSCLSSDEQEITYYSDTAITGFSLGTLNRVFTVKKGDTDSTYTKDFDASGYTMYIDQQKGLIYNPDSLPKGVDVSKVVCSVSTKNSGIAVIKNVDSDTLQYISSDSIDFTQQRIVYVYSNDGTLRREYKVNVNVHNEYGDTLLWHDKTAYTGFSALKGMKAVAMGSTLYVFGTDGTATKVFTTPTSDGNSWTEQTAQTFDADAWQSAITDSTHIFIYSGSQIWRSQNGTSWESVATVSGITRLIGAACGSLYALGSDNSIKASADGGSTWTAEQMEDGSDLTMLPSQDISLVELPVKTNPGISRVLAVGNRADNSDSNAVVWAKLTGETTGTVEPWSFYVQENENKYQAPRLHNLTAFKYDGHIVALGGEGIGACDKGEFSDLYLSVDEGVTWKADTLYVLPENLDCDKDVFAITADANNRIWIISGGEGKVWCGRVTRLGWLRQDPD